MPVVTISTAHFNTTGIAKGATLGDVGVPVGTSLTPLTDLTISTNNQTIDARDVSGTITVEEGVSGTLIKRCKFTGTGQSRGIVTTVATSLVTIEDCTFIGDYADQQLVGRNFTATRCEFSEFSNDAVNMGDNTILQDSWIHDAVVGEGAHADGVQGIDTPFNVTISNCLIDIGIEGNGFGDFPNSAIIITPFTTPVSGPGNYSFDHVTWGGGTYCVHVDTGFTDGISFTNCRFLDNPRAGRIQITDNGTPIPSPDVFTGNVNEQGSPLVWIDG